MSHTTLVDLIVTTSFSAGLILSGAAVIASLPWRDAEVADAEHGVRALFDRVARLRRSVSLGLTAVAAR